MYKRIAKPLLLTALFTAVIPVLTGPADAAEFRLMNRISSPGPLPEGAIPVAAIRPVSRRVAEIAVKRLMASWNTAQLEKYLSVHFYDKNRLLDNQR